MDPIEKIVNCSRKKKRFIKLIRINSKKEICLRLGLRPMTNLRPGSTLKKLKHRQPKVNAVVSDCLSIDPKCYPCVGFHCPS